MKNTQKTYIELTPDPWNAEIHSPNCGQGHVNVFNTPLVNFTYI